ncbi:magnesium-protoporphyrin IX monomethyl ester anaerobic oxidative cyclase [Aquincola sp. S2]|uniref:Magnesium-protoporphyrin IX monomethyl ester anaerobic oxidative cyclase n=1 Tax=Pseudaquabacterium terrae TaxID=2732868 RepID=A0ABX2E8Z8_9BURK|nr:magnesium-protoporphyrin IX monomethyl ester anaerobic oxidative cyclase [Aquabacterium terrae]NRF65389.1 magnesium-protoporphyrin IX monomethyl ester anaerobic oxidative cyclase [Aquabacterium terrae]
MKILLINPPHTAIGSRIPREHLPPLGLLSIGGPLIDAGFDVQLLDAEFGPLTLRQIVERTRAFRPDIVMLGHSGSSSAHATVLALCALLKLALPRLVTVYGGVHPTYHWDEILRESPQIDIVVRGEGEETTRSLVQALSAGRALDAVRGIAFRRDGRVIDTPAAEMILDLDAHRIGWELIDHRRYSYWGGKRAVVVQFARGCPYLCNYCGQRGYWTRWRHRDPVKLAKELARLHREHGVELINFADELPTGSRKAWQAFLEALIAENVPLLLVGSTRAGDIVRDADILHLYRRAGVIRFLLGIESYDEATLAAIKKGATTSEDAEAIRLLRQHGIVSMATYVIGFSEESDRDYWRSLRHLWRYDPDQIQLLFATPHRWTPFYDTVADRRVIQPDTRRWDYKHQVLAAKGVPPWRVFLWSKAIELSMQLRPRALARLLFRGDADFLHAMRWYTRIGRRVWFHEVAQFLFDNPLLKHGPTLREFLGPSLVEREYALARRRRVIPIDRAADPQRGAPAHPSRKHSPAAVTSPR